MTIKARNSDGFTYYGFKIRVSWFSIFVILLAVTINKEVNGTLKYSDACWSLNRELGKCVELRFCPLFVDMIRQRPIRRENIRTVVKLTCFYDILKPKVCCPVNEVDEEFNVIGDKSGFGVGHESNKKSTWVPDIIFPSDKMEPNRRMKMKFSQRSKFQLLPQLKDCSNSIRLQRLVGTYGTHPWIALIGSENKRTGQFEHTCTGTIINQKYILTSAHCVYESTSALTTIRLGDYNLDTEKDDGTFHLPSSTFKDYKIQKIVPHLGYHKTGRMDDIALIRVDREIDFRSNFIRPVCLPFVKQYGLADFLKVEELNDIVDKKALVTGWGKTTWNDETMSRTLKEAPVQFSPYGDCENSYRDRVTIQSKQICVGGRRRQNSCVVDSGGPLLAPVKLNLTHQEGFLSQKMFQLGILSLGPSAQQCNQSPLPPSVYTKVSAYLDWIVATIEP